MLTDNPLWYKDAVIYELHVRAFCDSVGDGYGDFRGLTQKLDYLQDLGITAIWLLPFYPSPLRDDGYDIADYTSIHPQYGNLAQFREFLDQAHERGLRVITELVVNHTSDQHPWFQRARRAPPGSPERDFYVWSDAPDKYRDARIIFKDFETSNWSFDRVAQSYFWHRFYSHQPDLNFENPAVWQALLPVVDFWLEMGVDGLRLDAVPYLFEREGTNCENLPETHQFLKSLRKHVDEKFPHRMLLAEANQWPEDAVAYFGEGDECHMAFHFPVMPRLFMAMHMEDRFPVIDILDQTPPIPAAAQWAMFLRNHDELTLEMVTDEERDYMYRAYASERNARINLGIRRRLAPLLGNNRRRIELMNGLLCSLPGTPVLYYGDEIGMGDNIYLGDRNGVRTPMQWSADRNAGFSRANPQKLYLPIIIDPEYHYEAINVEAQQNNPSSLLWWTKRLISQRRQYKAFGRGTIEFLHPDNRRILAFFREFEDERILVVANLSRFVQVVELDLSRHVGSVPMELFGGTQFPKVGTGPYLLTLAPHSFYWLQIHSQTPGREGLPAPRAAQALPEIWTNRDWERLFDQGRTRQLEAALRVALARAARTAPHRDLRSVRVREAVRIPAGGSAAYLVIADLEFQRAAAETRPLVLGFASAETAAAWSGDAAPHVVANINGAKSGVLYDALTSPSLCEAFLELIAQSGSLPGTDAGELHAWRSSAFSVLRGDPAEILPPVPLKVEQANTSVRLGTKLILKAYRRVEEGPHPEWELGRFLTETQPLGCVPKLAGSVEYRRGGREPVQLLVLHEFIPHEGDAWQLTLDHLSVFFEGIATAAPFQGELARPLSGDLGSQFPPPPDFAADLLHGFLEMVRLLGTRLGELHTAMGKGTDRPELAPESMSSQYQRSLYQSMRNTLFDAFDSLDRYRGQLSPEQQELATQVRNLQPVLLQELRGMLGRRIQATVMRYHGDLNLHQILSTGKDFAFIDFEGRPGLSLGERRLKRSPLRDVVSLLRSFDYAALATLDGLVSARGRASGVIREADRPALLPWCNAWRQWVRTAFLNGYFTVCESAHFVPRAGAERTLYFRVLQLDKLLQELNDEITMRPNWGKIPLTGLVEAVG